MPAVIFAAHDQAFAWYLVLICSYPSYPGAKYQSFARIVPFCGAKLRTFYCYRKHFATFFHPHLQNLTFFLLFAPYL